MKKIGIVNIDTSHPQGFSELMLKKDFGMRYAMIYNDGFRGDAEVESFMKTCGITHRASSIDELAENTDVGFIQSCNWDKHLEQAMPFIERGKPVFIDKPIVGSVRDIARVRELVKNGAQFLGSSSARYAAEVQEFLAMPVSERGEVVAVYGESGVDEFNYGSHIGEIISEIAGAAPVSCAYIGDGEADGKKSEIFSAKFANGVRGTYCTHLAGWRKFNISVMTTLQSYAFTIDSSKIYEALLLKVSESLNTGVRATADPERLLEASELMLCGKRSRDFENGAAVRVCDLKDTDGFDGYAFEKGYAAASDILYK